MARERYDSDDDRRDRRRRVSPISRSPSPYRSKSSKYDGKRNSYHSRREPSSERSRRHRSSYSRSRSPDRKSRHQSAERSSRHRRREYRDERRGGDRSYDRRKRLDSISPSSDNRRSKKPLPSQQDAFDNEAAVVKKSPPPEKLKPNFGTTGRLAAESNTITSADGQAIVLKYHEPPEARKPAPKDAWRIYVFKGADIMETVELGQRSCWLFGRESAVADFPIEHPSCSKQHAVIQFRYVEKKNEYGDRSGKVRPYIIDLESANGTDVNGEKMPSGRYLELRDKDVIKFGQSSREYVIMLPPKE